MIPAQEEQGHARRLQVLMRIVLGLVPFGVVVSELLPDVVADEQDRMLRTLRKNVNALQVHLGITDAGVDPLALEIAKFAARHCWNSEPESFVRYEEIARALPFRERDADAAFSRMQRAGWIVVAHDANSPLGFGGFCCEAKLFAAVLPEVNGVNPLADAIQISHYLLAQDTDDIGFEAIKAHFDWEQRRLYLGLWFLKDNVLTQQFEVGYSPETPLHYVDLDGENRVRLQDFVSLSE